VGGNGYLRAAMHERDGNITIANNHVFSFTSNNIYICTHSRSELNGDSSQMHLDIMFECTWRCTRGLCSDALEAEQGDDD